MDIILNNKMLNEQKITYRMVNLIESGFFGRNKSLLTEAFADRDKVKIFQAAYNYTYDKNISVDGIKGTQTNAAIEAVKKDLGKEKLDDTNIKEFYTKFITKLEENSANINVGEGGSNNNRNLNYAIQTLLTIAGQPIAIDGVVGTKTITAIKALTNNESSIINKDNLSGITDLAVKTNVQEGLGIEDIATVQSNARDQVSNANTQTKGTCVEGNCVNGQGKFVASNKDEYIGTFVNGKLTGKNNKIIYISVGSTFEGETQDNKKYTGTHVFKDNSVYQGYFLNEKLHGDNSLYISSTGKRGRGNFRNGSPVGATWGQLDNSFFTDDGKETVFPTPAMQAAANDLQLKEAFNNDMKKLVKIIKDYRNLWGFYRVKSANDFRFYDSVDNEIFRTTNVFKELADIPSGRFWLYRPDTKTIFFYEGNKNYYVHTITGDLENI